MGKYEGAVLKVKLPALQKVRLISNFESDLHYFWRWSLLNSYHYLPHFKAAGHSIMRRWIDLEPTTWQSWESTAWGDISGMAVKAEYSVCNQSQGG